VHTLPWSLFLNQIKKTTRFDIETIDKYLFNAVLYSLNDEPERELELGRV